MFSLEQQQLIERAKYPLFAGELEGATYKAFGENQSCGDEVTMQLKEENGVITEIKHQCRACTICQASADLLAEVLLGKTRAEVANFSTEEVQNLIQVPLSPTRLKCALLPLKVLLAAFKNPLL